MLARLRPGEFASLFSEGIEPSPPTLAARRQAALRDSTTTRARSLVGALARVTQPATLRRMFTVWAEGIDVTD